MKGQKLVFGSKNQVGYNIYSFIPIGQHLFIQALSGVRPENDETKTLNKIAGHLRLRENDEIPFEPGTCIDGGFVSLYPEYEKVTVGIRLKEFPDVHFSVEVHKNQNALPERSDLETRLKGAEEEGGSWFERVKFFRRGPRQLGDWIGLEALAHKPAQENTTGSHEFHFISLGAPNDTFKPQLDVQLDTGADGNNMSVVKPSLSDEETVALWDKLIGSIRVRPVNAKKAEADGLLKTPLASLVSTGDRCPQTGWWQCAEHGDVEGGRRRHFAAGDRLPHAILLGEPQFWQRLTGDRPKHKTVTIWEFVESDDEPAAQLASSPVADAPPVARAPAPPFL